MFLIDADSGILLLEHSFKQLANYMNGESQVLANFFQTLNSTIDDIHKSMRKGRDLSHMDRILNSEGATVVLHYHPEGRVLFASVADADDNVEKILDLLKDLSRRFWKIHASDVEQFRLNSQKDVFKSFLIDIQMLLLNGKVAENFPKLTVSELTLERVFKMGMITKQELTIAKLCNGSNSPLQLSRKMELHMSDIQQFLRHLVNLDIIQSEL